MQRIEPAETQRELVALSDYTRERGKPMPNITHGAVQMLLGAQFLAQAQGKFLVLSELTLEFEDGKPLVPNLSILPKRALNWGDEPVRCKETPLLVVEIISPTQGYLEIHEKRNAYFAHGVESVWVVEPDLQAIAIYRPSEARPQIIQQGEATDFVTGLTVRLEEVFY